MTPLPRIEVGDSVRVVVPRFVARVGYPKQVEDYLPQVDGEAAKLNVFLQALRPDDHKWRARTHSRGVWHEQHPAWVSERVFDRIRKDVAYSLAQADGFGGRERSIHWTERPELAGATVRVCEVRVVNTGMYYPASTAYYGSGSHEYDYEPGGLDDRRTHRLLRLALPQIVPAKKPANDYAFGDWTVAEHVEALPAESCAHLWVADLGRSDDRITRAECVLCELWGI